MKIIKEKDKTRFLLKDLEDNITFADFTVSNNDVFELVDHMMNNLKRFQNIEDFKDFPVLTDLQLETKKIKLNIAKEVYKGYTKRYGTGQSLERIAERGGFSVNEIILLLYQRTQTLEAEKKKLEMAYSGVP